MLWIGPRLSTLERLSMASFVANGHEVHLYTYGDVEGIPDGVAHRYAGDVLPPSSVFSDPAGFGAGSFTGFSDFFRYKLLFDRGGMWCDTDVVCLRPFDFIDEDFVIARERIHPDEATPEAPERLNACVLKAPAESAVLAECVQICAAVDKNSLDWADIGANLVTRVFADHGLFGTALPAQAICPFDSWDAPSLTSAPLPDDPAGYAVHFWNEMWRRYGADKDGSYAEESVYEVLKRRYGLA
jgi:hypothetical protein